MDWFHFIDFNIYLNTFDDIIDVGWYFLKGNQIIQNDIQIFC